jgi:hypothetical protein
MMTQMSGVRRYAKGMREVGAGSAPTTSRQRAGYAGHFLLTMSVFLGGEGALLTSAPAKWHPTQSLLDCHSLRRVRATPGTVGLAF